MKQKNILFVCKHNIFRSKIAEAYFKKINKNKNIKLSSAGIIKGDLLNRLDKKLIKIQKETAKVFGIEIGKSSKYLSISLLGRQDIIVVVADDVPKEIFKNKFYMKPDLKIMVWKIQDAKKGKDNRKIIKESIRKIMKKVDRLVRKLE